MTNETQVMPAVALRGITILPDMIVHFDVSRKKIPSGQSKRL